MPIAEPLIARSAGDLPTSAVDQWPDLINELGRDPADAPIRPPHILARFARPFEVMFS